MFTKLNILISYNLNPYGGISEKRGEKFVLVKIDSIFES